MILWFASAAYLKNRDYLKSENQLDSHRFARIELPCSTT